MDWRELLKELKGEGASARNMEVIIITDAGAESMDLKGVRHIVLSDPTWTDALRRQIIGRGQRYKAHAHLSPSKRRIDVWQLYLDPPKDAGRGTNSLFWSSNNMRPPHPTPAGVCSVSVRLWVWLCASAALCVCVDSVSGGTRNQLTLQSRTVAAAVRSF